MARHILNPAFTTDSFESIVKDEAIGQASIKIEDGESVIIENCIFIDPNECQHDNGYILRPLPIVLERRVGATAQVICDVHCVECDALLEKGELK